MRPPWPRSLLARNLALLVVLTVIGQLCVTTLFIAFIQRPRIDEVASLVAAQTLLVQHLLDALPEPQRSKELAAINGGKVVDGPDAPPALRAFGKHRSYVLRRFLGRLLMRLPSDTQIRWEDSRPRRLWVRLEIAGGYRWVMMPLATSIDGLLPLSLLGLLLTLAVFPALGAWLIQRHMASPLGRLARAASEVARGAWPERVPLEGPTELRTVADAFNGMVVSLKDMEGTRAEMLAGISHDIRTPLTKLHMALAAPESFEAPGASAERFVAEIDAIVQQFIDFARGWDNEPAVPGDLNGLIEQLAGDYAGLGYSFELALAPLGDVPFRPVSLQRLLMNLMHNAAIYGRVGLRVRSWREPGCAVLSVEDAGPGVPQALLPLLTQPFRRGDQAHRKAGTGLGLAIAERIARQHGGRLELASKPGGGLAATVFLPLD